jgi:hypothetical protein
MLKRLTRKLVTLSVLCAALAAVPSTPAPSTTSGLVCERQVSENSCIIYCCDRWGCYQYPCN